MMVFLGLILIDLGFKKLISDIENGKINMVITKDLSRLGRDHIETGNLLEKYFPLHNIRYVAINDSYDSFLEDSNSNDFAPFKNVFNDMYAKDISKKVRTALHTKQLNGEFIGTSAPIGYMKDTENRNKLVINPKTEYIVKRIFKEFLLGKGINEITKGLIIDKIPTPSEFANISNTGKLKGIWNSTTVRRILKNEVYIGNTVGGKVKKINYKLKKQALISKDKWIKIENTHEAIISKTDFKKVQNILNKRSYIPKSGSPHLLTGIIYCKKCGAKFSFVNAYKKGEHYAICRNVKTYGKKFGLCDNNSIKEDVLESAILNSLKEISKKYANENYILNNTNNKEKYSLIKADLLKEKTQLNLKLEQANTLLFNLYKDKVNTLIDKQTFIDFSNKINEEKNTYIKRLKSVDDEVKKIDIDEINSNNMTTLLIELLSFENINRNMLLQLIDKIVIDNTIKPSKITIYFKFNVNKEILI